MHIDCGYSKTATNNMFLLFYGEIF